MDWQKANADHWKEHPEERPITFDEEGRPTIWWYLLAFPMICFFCTLHFLGCSLLTIFVHPESRRYKIYEYYAPWGWGKRNPHE
jgi:hypothetical protein